MNNKTFLLRSAAKLTAAAVLCIGGAAAHAQSLAGWSVYFGGSSIQPQVSSGDLSPPSLPGTKINVDNAAQVSGGFAYDYSDEIRFNFAVISLPFKHDIKGDGAIKGVGKIGSVKQLPPTVFAQWKFLDAKSQFRPYAGLGLTYAYFFKEEGSGTLTALTNPGGTPTTLSVDSKFALTPQLGMLFNVNEKWYVDANVSKTFLKTKSKLSTGQTIDVKLDPLAINLWVGYRF
jgi:outer membrane protein